ncbi:hypothetical protein Sjap_020509 [Stephania japonica]|uniref:Uncharacterized protein n=1 Tax=Stephania japonica TaxID=461633 RepID=A0AAP0F0T0_9MAGN
MASKLAMDKRLDDFVMITESNGSDLSVLVGLLDARMVSRDLRCSDWNCGGLWRRGSWGKLKLKSRMDEEDDDEEEAAAERRTEE